MGNSSINFGVCSLPRSVLKIYVQSNTVGTKHNLHFLLFRMKGTRYFQTSGTAHPTTQRHATVNTEDGVTNDVLLFTVACTSWQTLTWLQVVSSQIKPNILGASAKFRKATISFVMSVCLSIRLRVCPFAWHNCSNWTDCNTKISRECSPFITT
jgi:hypothetical protein